MGLSEFVQTAARRRTQTFTHTHTRTHTHMAGRLERPRGDDATTNRSLPPLPRLPPARCPARSCESTAATSPPDDSPRARSAPEGENPGAAKRKAACVVLVLTIIATLMVVTLESQHLRGV